MIAYVDNKDKICKALLGYTSIEYENVIITPLRNIFENLRALSGMPKVNDDGFYSNFSFTIKSGMDVFVICIPQGMQAQDIMYALSKKKILFLGYAGSLTAQNNIGDIVEVDKAFICSGECISLSADMELKKVTVGYSPVLVGDLAEKFHSAARSLGCVAVDMETSYCAAAAAKNGNIFSSVLLISDIIGRTEFWELDIKDIECFTAGNKKLLKFVLEHYDRRKTI